MVTWHGGKGAFVWSSLSWESTGGRLAVVLGVAAYALVAAAFDAYTWPMRVATSIPMLAVGALAFARGWHRPGRVPGDDAGPLTDQRRLVGLGTWLVMLGVLGAFQLAIYLSQPRERYPTLSSLASDAFGFGPVRALAFATWCLLGGYLVARR